MKRNPGLDYGQWAVLVSVAACVVASWARLSSHQLWQDVVILVSGVVIALFGLLLALNWHGMTERYSSPVRRLSPKAPRHHAHQLKMMRVGGGLLTLQALAAIVSSINWLIVLLAQ
jgi:hypothetical protein